MKIIKGMCCFIFVFMMSLSDASRLIVTDQKFGHSKISNGLNRTPVKTIKSPDGDIIDCIHVLHQPAFDHPLLKNHTIQMSPDSYPKGLFRGSKMSGQSKNDSETITQLWQLNGRCPDGTIPIIRTTQKDDLTLKNFPQGSDGALHEYATVTTATGKYYGGEAFINVWNPQVQDKNAVSLSQMSIIGVPGAFENAIEVGWAVNPHIFGDTKTRFFTHWTRDGYHTTGCYNLKCPGFVQTSNKVALGAFIRPLSTYHGDQKEIVLFVWKDRPYKGEPKWWLRYGDVDVGYWPAALFTDLADTAALVRWGGEVATTNSSGSYTTTQMGSGHFPEEKYGGASFFRVIHTVDDSSTVASPGPLTTFVTKPNCYNLEIGQHSELWEDNFYYGGPGRNPNCQ